MRDFALRVIINAVAIAITAELLSGIQVQDERVTTFLIIGLIFGVVNATIKPILALLTCPLIFLTLGLFLFVINGIMLQIADLIAGSRLEVDGLITAIIGGIIMGLVGMVLEGVLGLDDDKKRQPRERPKLR